MSSWPSTSWGSGSLAFDGTKLQDPSASFAAGTPVQTEMFVAPNSVHLLHFLIAQAKDMQRDIADRATMDDLEGLRNLVGWQVSALSDLSRRAHEQVSVLNARVMHLEAASRCSCVAADATRENTPPANTNDVPVARFRGQSRLDGFSGNGWPDQKPKGMVPSVMSPWPVIASPVIFAQDSLPYGNDYGAIGSHLPHDLAVGFSGPGESTQSSGSSVFMDSVLDREIAALEVSLYHLCDDDDKISSKEFSLSEPSDLQVALLDDGTDSGVGCGSGPDTIKPSLTPLEVKDFYRPVAGEQQDQEHYHLLKSVGHHVLNVAVRLVGSLFCGQSF